MPMSLDRLKNLCEDAVNIKQYVDPQWPNKVIIPNECDQTTMVIFGNIFTPKRILSLIEDIETLQTRLKCAEYELRAFRDSV